MRFLAALVLVLLMASPVMADEFGERFSNEAPQALESGTMPTPQNIEPAAGEESAVEKELEQKFGTEVRSTHQDLGDGQIETHDSVGSGNVRMFYESEYDGRVMNDDDAIGVELRLLEFD